MKKFIILLIITILSIVKAAAQTTPTPVEKNLADSICACMNAVDLSKINSKNDAMAVITNCFGKRTDLLLKIAEERHVNPADQDAMKQIGVDVGKDLINENCAVFLKISEKLISGGDSQTGANDSKTTGKLKRMDIKGFNYIVITDNANSEKSFIWLRQFPGSEKFMNGVTAFAGKPVKITWHEMEVYLPLAKGYYKLKEITAIDFL